MFLESNRKDTCHACGRTIAECSCDAVRERLRTLARKLIEAGHQAFRRSELHRARRLFARAVATDGAVCGGWEAFGLCALALGDPKTALIAWRTAERLDHGPELDRWITSLQSGDVRDALVTYNGVLGYARADNWGAALEGLAEVERRLPGFLPAVRLQGLVLTAMGKAESAQEVWERGLAACRDDEFLRCHATAIGAQVPQSSSIRVGAVTPMFGRSAAFGAGVLSVALVIGGISFWPARGAQLGGSTKAGALSASAAHLRGAPLNAMPPGSVVLGVALDGAVDSLAALIRMTGPDTALWSASSRRRAVSLLRRAGWDHYRSGMVALRAGNYGEATNGLRLAVEYGRGDFFEDDALYALSGAYAQLGDKALASHSAIQLLETFPTSIFANSMTRRLARLSGRR